MTVFWMSKSGETVRATFPHLLSVVRGACSDVCTLEGGAMPAECGVSDAMPPGLAHYAKIMLGSEGPSRCMGGLARSTYLSSFRRPRVGGAGGLRHQPP